jgi:hypothetical protein
MTYEVFLFLPQPTKVNSELIFSQEAASRVASKKAFKLNVQTSMNPNNLSPKCVSQGLSENLHSLDFCRLVTNITMGPMTCVSQMMTAPKNFALALKHGIE